MRSLTHTLAIGFALPGIFPCLATHRRLAEHSIGPIIHTPDGAVVHGIIDQETAPDVHQFLGVPFAEPPIGDLRWAPPKSLIRTRRVVDATHKPAACPQNPNYNGTHGRLNPQFLSVGPFSEDCLTSNIYTPAGTYERLPVIIFIFGGTFQVGSTNVPYYNAAPWVQRSHAHVVVTVNYRINIFGFPGAAGLKEQNLGLLDQRRAVEWIEANIAAFGGDPQRMILWGQSDGGTSVDYYNFAYVHDPIVKGLIMDSGSALLPMQNEARLNTSAFSYVADHTGCTTEALNDTEVLQCMRQVSAQTIENVINSTTALGNFLPVVDERYVFSDYTARALAGNQTWLPAIMGSNRNDAEGLLSDWISDEVGPNRTDVFVADLAGYICPVVNETHNRQVTGRITYRYEYAGNFSNLSPVPWEGAYHAAELPLIFGSVSLYGGASTPFEKEVMETIQDAWVAFAKDPAFGLIAYKWPPNTKQNNHVKLWAAKDMVSQIQEGTQYQDRCPQLWSRNVE